MEPSDIFTSLGPWRWVFAQRSGTDSSRGLHSAGIQYKFICIKHSDKEKCGWTCVPAIYTMHLNCPRTEDVCLRALHCQSFTWVEFIILRKGAARQEEHEQVYCKVALVFEKWRNLVELYFSAMTCRCPSLGALRVIRILAVSAACCQKIPTFVNV